MSKPSESDQAPRFPYEYGSDLHWFWGWGQRIRAMLDDGQPPSNLDWMTFRPDRLARDAMMRFSVQFQHIIKQVDDYLEFAEARFDDWENEDTDTTRDSFWDALDSLEKRIEVGAQTISQLGAAPLAEAPLPKVDIKPRWRRDTGTLTVAFATAKQIKNLRQATNTVAILDAFELEGWPDRIDDPLRGGRNPERLRDAIESLNRNLSMLRFVADGTGEGIRWDVAE